MTQNASDVRILSLNGGGARGLFTISVLAEIERIIEESTSKQGVKAGDYFDLITGTSIGGILALGLAAGKSARELESVFREKAPEIFPARFPWLKKVRKLFGPQYSSEPLRQVVASMVGENTVFNDLERRVMIPAVNLSTGKPQFFKTPHNSEFHRDGRIPLVDAAMATSAAPTYFAPHYCRALDAYFADGGLVANNPSFIGLLEALHDMRADFDGVTVEKVKVLNIGTLSEEYAVKPSALTARRNNGYLGLWGLGERLVLTTMTSNQLLHKGMLLRELRLHRAEDNYVSIDDSIPNEAASDITLDNASQGSLQNLAGRGRQLATEHYTQDARVKDFFQEPATPFKNRHSIRKEKVR